MGELNRRARKSARRLVLSSLLILAPGLSSLAQASPPAAFRFEREASTRRVVVASWDRPAALAARDAGSPFVAPGFPLPSGASVDLELEPFEVTSRRARFVLGTRGGADRPLEFDPSSLLLFRGRVAGHPQSRVFLALSEAITTGHVEISGRRYGVSSRDADGRSLEAGRLTVFESVPAAGSKPPRVPLCGVEGESEPAESAWSSPGGGVSGAPSLEIGTQHLELAVETDYEFYGLFDDPVAAAAYLVALYAQVSDIYLRDVDTWIELVYARLWDDPDDLFNVVDPSPLPDFRNHWNAYMSGVERDVAQLLSGRRDYPFGGQAYLSALCGGAGYSVVGYALGFFPDPSEPSPYNYDIAVTAHEIGHNAGTGHTHDNGIDTCDDPVEEAQRGTIMSYCGQTWSGGNANRDGRFHTTIQTNMRNHIFSRSCVVDDCNLNGVADSTDILEAASQDVDGNGTPDECEDCNGNLVLDDEDLLQGTSLDVNGNGIPDECDPDCDADGIPDDKEIDDGTAIDLHGDGVPDACEADCDSSGGSDYSQIQVDMTLDVDRNAVLDSCQDCDDDGTPDLTEIDGAHSVWLASGLTSGSAKRFLPTTGVLTRVSQSGPASFIREGRDLLATPDGRFLVSSAADHTVKEFAADGNYLRNAVSANAGGLSGPSGLWLGQAGSLLVASAETDEVLEYDLATGTPLGALVAADSGGLVGPFGLTGGPDGALYVTSETGEVLRYDMTDGTFLGTFVTAAANGGLDRPRGLVFKGDGNLLVTSYGTDEVLEYDGETGAPLGKWARVGTATRLTQTSPWGIRVGPNGNVFVVRTGEDYGSGPPDDHEHDDEDDILTVVGANHETDHGHGETGALHLTDAQIYEYDVRDGSFIRAHITGNDHEFLFPTGFDFIPGWDVDCNYNLVQDDCDIASGASADADSSGVPDECELDCNGNGTLDRLDIIPFGASLDCNANLSPDSCDISSGLSEDCTGNGIPDECEADCNKNGVADACEIQSGASRDCDADGVPDECNSLVDFETAPPGWVVGDAGDTATAGVWQRGNPNGTAAQSEFDRTPGDGRSCYFTRAGTDRWRGRPRGRRRRPNDPAVPGAGPLG